MRHRAWSIAAAVALAGAVVLAASLPPAAARAENPATRQETVRERTVTFAVENMTCALCPVTVRKAMAGVPGVRKVSVDFVAKTATVVFDPAETSAERIAAASAKAGYPAKPAG